MIPYEILSEAMAQVKSQRERETEFNQLIATDPADVETIDIHYSQTEAVEAEPVSAHDSNPPAEHEERTVASMADMDDEPLHDTAGYGHVVVDEQHTTDEREQAASSDSLSEHDTYGALDPDMTYDESATVVADYEDVNSATVSERGGTPDDERNS